ncbi:MAG TPA: MraY family glycosyltransferase [Jatrophihabitans sp.]|jgi:UDP-GlcNAc:undecaprenyl-phosphate GlcNAc-1-phosphate transferase|uniref:glycosyltransferase family 4 protein n=1 Tax=Jatrophihabitans sp. TaxID=1932789 RepID=UPI002DF91124|nr:MraY family glycosyltransferase [Jatrophihabitans sp.]
MTHPSLEYVLVGCIGALVTFLLTPLARRAAIRWGAVALPRDRDVHAVATPRMGGVALFAGVALALFVAQRLPTLHGAFDKGPEMAWVVGAAAIICLIGILDDIFELDSLTKLAGQVLATGLMVTLGGVQLGSFYFPFGDSGTVVLGSDLAIPVTILLTVLTINAMNFIDGLDGLAAGVTAIAAGAFFVFSYHLTQQGYLDVAATPTLLAAVLAGACLGFLPHNFFPARIFMGDSGSMLVGLLLSAAATTATTSADPQSFKSAFGGLPLLLPLLIPVAVLALPFVDLLLAVFRRVGRGSSPFAPDKQHLHHRLLEIGHSHRRAVLLLYFWSALLAFAGVAVSFSTGPWVVVSMLIALVVVGLVVSLVPGLRSRLRKGRVVTAAEDDIRARNPASGRPPVQEHPVQPGSV